MEQARQPSVATRFVTATAVLLTLALVAIGCGGDDSSSSSQTNQANQGAPTDEGPPVEGGTLRVAVGADIDGLNPIQARWSLEGNLIGSSIYDGLVTFDEERQLVPRLAETVTPNADGTVWTIKVREGVRFHDGTPFDAAAVKANLDARKAVPISGDSLRNLQEVVVIDPTTVEVRMSRPWFGFDYLLAAQTGYMVAPSIIGASDSMQRPVGTGPFKLEGTWSPDTPVNVVRNDDYWGDRAHLDGIEFRAIVDQTSRTAALEAGNVDMILTQDPGAVSSFRNRGGYIQVEDVASSEAFVMLNLTQPPFDNIHARRALAYATDRNALNQAVGGGIQADANQPFTPSEDYYVDDPGYPDYDPDRAREELELYKQDTGEDTLRFTFKTTSASQQKIESEALQGQWQAVGIQAQLEQTEQATFLANIFVGDFQAAMFQNFGWVNPENNYIFWHSSHAKQEGQSGGINFGGIRSAELDAALDAARSTSDPQERIERQKDAVRALNAEVPYIWMYHAVWAFAANDNVGGLSVPQNLGFARQDAKPWWNRIWLKQ